MELKSILRWISGKCIQHNMDLKTTSRSIQFTASVGKFEI